MLTGNTLLLCSLLLDFIKQKHLHSENKNFLHPHQIMLNRLQCHVIPHGCPRSPQPPPPAMTGTSTAGDSVGRAPSLLAAPLPTLLSYWRRLPDGWRHSLSGSHRGESRRKGNRPRGQRCGQNTLEPMG